VTFCASIKLGLIFNSKDFIHWFDEQGNKQNRIGKREYVSYLGTAEEFKKLFFSAAIRNGYGLYKQTILLSDGATWIRNMKEDIFPDAQQVLDLYHLCKNISKFSKIIFQEDEYKYKTWSKEVCELFKASKNIEAIKMITEIRGKNTKDAKYNLLNYIEINKNNIDYAAYKNRGWYLGSGAIESGNKSVFQFRVKQAGMRWNQETAQFILSLMAKSKSSLWDDVKKLVRNRYEIEGVYKILRIPIAPRP
jgi:hypothetical protein